MRTLRQSTAWSLTPDNTQVIPFVWIIFIRWSLRSRYRIKCNFIVTLKNKKRVNRTASWKVFGSKCHKKVSTLHEPLPCKMIIVIIWFCLHINRSVILTMAEHCTKDVKDVLKRIEDHQNVVGVIIVDCREGQAVHSTLDAMETNYYIQHCTVLTDIARGTIRETDPTDDIQFFRIRTKKYEIMLAPEHDYLLIVLQNTTKMAAKFPWTE